MQCVMITNRQTNQQKNNNKMTALFWYQSTHMRNAFLKSEIYECNGSLTHRHALKSIDISFKAFPILEMNLQRNK